ncbi:MAG: ABC transporter ATP-binding protein [Bacteroidales bacterium]|nr:ABC transporter ATP-binding protein [Bacteroidales bacterium]MCF8386506.1 ABC transporter ATP-binding protein [Bacteroidales bacterium]MCF8397090.1 ABC transporter ATP-binding protein [Bacteroidales bacterium]
MQKSVISVDKLSKYYGPVLGIKDISFEVSEGEIFGFLGPNGAGKTTTIKILLDLLRPSNGVARILGKDVNKSSYEIRTQLGYLPGEFSAYAHLRMKDFFLLMSEIRKCSFPVDSDLIRDFDIRENDLQKKIKALSHGTLQKLGIIQALFHQPKLLILDEPTTGLDPLMKEVLYDLLIRERQKGTSIFFSSHNLDEVEKLCDRVAIIRRGEIVGLESLETLKNKAGQILEFRAGESCPEPALPGATLIRKQNNHFQYRLQGDVRQLMRRLVELPLSDVSISKPDLEDLFMQYYQDKNGFEDDI